MLQLDQPCHTNIDIRVNSAFMISFRRFTHNSWLQLREFTLKTSVSTSVKQTE